MTDPITTLRGKLQQLEAQHQSGTLGKKAYDRSRAALERELLDHVLAAPPATAAPAAPATPAAAAMTPATRAPRPPVRLIAALAATVVAVAGAGYWWKGAPSLLAGVPAAAAGAEPASPHDSGGPQFAAAVEQLAEKLKAQPDNAEGWAMLARSYLQLGRLPDALPAFAKAVALQGEDARLLADYADALAVQNNRSLEGEPTALIDRALKIEPNNPKALALAGTAAFNRKDFAGAVRHWEKLAQTAPADSPFLGQLQSSIAEARELGGLGPARTQAAAAPVPPPKAAAAEGGAAAVVNGTVSGTVTLAPALKAKVSPDDAIFVFARAATGSRMPLAFMRAQVKDLPLAFTLDDSMAMSPAAGLSTAAGEVVVDARISKSGQAMPQAGDLEGLSPPTSPGSAGINVVIAGEVK